MKLGRADCKEMSEMLEMKLFLWARNDDSYRQTQRERLKTMQKQKAFTWSAEDREHVIMWMPAWLEHAGWECPTACPRLFKALFMTAFPFLKPVDYGMENPIPVWERTLHVMSSVIKRQEGNESEVEVEVVNATIRSSVNFG